MRDKGDAILYGATDGHTHFYQGAHNSLQSCPACLKFGLRTYNLFQIYNL